MTELNNRGQELVLAAKAVRLSGGYNRVTEEFYLNPDVAHPADPKRRWWNPIDDDGDAFRLGTRVGVFDAGMPIRHGAFQHFYREELSKDKKPSEAVRHAIVKVAAKVGAGEM